MPSEVPEPDAVGPASRPPSERQRALRAGMLGAALGAILAILARGCCVRGARYSR